MEKCKDITTEFEAVAVRVSRVSIIGNLLLSLVKLITGIFAFSGALISDAIHSLSDVFSSIIVIIGVKFAAKESDEHHPYGHERIESVAAIVLAVILCITGLFIGHTAVENLAGGAYMNLKTPGTLALAAAAVSILSKEGMYWYTKCYAVKFDSSALMADAWHHRSDAMSSIGSLIGIGGARLGYLWFDPVASIVICIFILKASYDIFAEAVGKMVDQACSSELQQAFVEMAKKQEGVIAVLSINTREFGSRIYVDLEIAADGHLTLIESNKIALKVHDAVENKFPKIKHINVVVRPC